MCKAALCEEVKETDIIISKAATLENLHHAVQVWMQTVQLLHLLLVAIVWHHCSASIVVLSYWTFGNAAADAHKCVCVAYLCGMGLGHVHHGPLESF